jgi:porin
MKGGFRKTALPFSMKITLSSLLSLLLALNLSAADRAPATEVPADVSFLDQLGGHAPPAITGNPGAENVEPGTGLLGRLLHIPDETGLRLGGLWLGDSNGILSGGAHPGQWSFNSLLIVGANLDAEKLLGWKGASFGIQFLQFNGQSVNGQNTNGLAGSVQGFNSLPGPDPLNRSELYQLW